MRQWRRILLLILLCATAQAQEGELAEKSRAAKQALQAARYADAVRLYRELTRALPENAGMRFNLGLALEKNGSPAEAIPELERATKSQPDFAQAWFLLGLAYQQLGQPQKAIAPLREAVKLDAHNNQALLELADAALAAGDAAAAAGDFRTLAKRQPAMAKAWQGLGLAYLDLAERVFGMLSERSPQSGYWSALAARARAGEGRYANALLLYQDAVRQLPALPGLHEAKAAIYRQTNHPEWAAVEEERERSLPKLECGSPRAVCAYLAGNWEEALAEARKAATPENFYWTVLAYGKLAEQCFARVAALPESPEIHELLAESFRRMGRRTEAVAEWSKALAQDQGNRRLQARLAEALARNRQYEEAERLLNPLAAHQPANAEWQYLLGDVLLEQHREAEALPHLVQAVRLLPDFPPAQEALGRTYLALGRTQEAIDHLERARTIDDGAISYALSSAYRKLGRTEDANAALARYRQFTADRGTPAAKPGENVIPPP
jgi:tetratricopeptide (TPR) repeat protein